MWRIEPLGTDVILSDRKRTHITLPNCSSNLRFIGEQLIAFDQNSSINLDAWDDSLLIKLSELAQPLFFGNIIDVDSQKYISKLSATISLKSGLEGFFSLKRFKEFNLGVLLIHQKGEAFAWQLNTGNASKEATSRQDLIKFNSLFSAVKKSKNGQFSTQPKWSWLPFSGAFIAETFAFHHFNAIWIISREEFLPFSIEEVNEFQTFSKLIGVWLETLIELEFTDLRLSEIIWILERCQVPVIIQDAHGVPIFTNSSYTGAPQSELSWLPIGKSFELGVGKRNDWDNAEIDVFHRHKISLLGDLFNTLRHELSNPLFGLGLACDLLLTVDSPTETHLMLGEIKKNILRSQNIIHNLSKLYSENDMALKCDARQILNEAITLAKSELKTIKKFINDSTENEELLVEGKPLLVVQILFNLLINSAQAIRNTVATPEIKINITRTESHVHITISDNGPGLPQLIKENIFRPFYTTKSQGHGLGLALSRDLALKIGGDLVYHDAQPGATFSLILKRAV